MNIKLKIPLLLTTIVVFGLPSFAGTIGPICSSCDGGIYSLTYNPTPIATTASTQTFAITLQVDDSNFTGSSADFLNDVAIKVTAGDPISATLASSPAGYSLVSGGINASGCDGSGVGFLCADA